MPVGRSRAFSAGANTAVARWRASDQGWSGESEATLAVRLIGARMATVSNAAAQLVAKRWREIERLANGASAVRALALAG